MIENPQYQFGIHRLRYARSGLEIVFDPRVNTITFYPGSGKMTLPHNGAFGDEAADCGSSIRLDEFANFEEDLQRIDAAPSFSPSDLRDNFKEIANSREAPEGVWRVALGDFAFLLLRYAHKHNQAYEAVAKDVLQWLGARSARTAWRLAYDQRLTFEHRYKLLKAGQSESRRGAAERYEEGELDLPERKEREYLWWGTLVRYELSQEWCEGERYGNPSAAQALRESAIAYLHILKDAPRKHDLQRFLSECGTDVEGQVKSVLFGSQRSQRPSILMGGSNSRPNADVSAPHPSLRRIRLARLANRTHDNNLSLVKDEVIRKVFFVWFLKRYAWWSACKLIFSDSKKARFFLALAMFAGMNAAAMVLYVDQTREIHGLAHYLSFLPSPENSTPILWTAQALLQLSSLLSILIIAPELFRLLMPRALFGSLLAWSTVIFTALRDIHELKMKVVGEVGEAATVGDTKEWAITSLCHSATCTDAQAFGYSLLICAGILILDLIFIGYTVTQFTEGFWTRMSRIASTLVFLLLGSLFWAGIFALPIKVALERDAFMIDCHCIVPIVLIGSSIAILFGLMVELIWKDHSLAEPLGEPL
jgi:hypothetical protein